MTLIQSKIAGVLILAIILVGCDDARDISNRDSAREIINRCLRTRQELFLVARTTRDQQFAEQTGVLLAPPGSPFAPPSMASYTSGKVVEGGYWRVVRVVPPSTKLIVERVWLLETFEGGAVSTQGRLESGEIADLSWLMNLEWKLPVNYEKGQGPAGEPFDLRYVGPCQ